MLITLAVIGVLAVVIVFLQKLGIKKLVIVVELGGNRKEQPKQLQNKDISVRDS